MTKKILLSGIQPSGKPHVGNYFGMMKQMIDLQDAHQSFFFIPDYHALNSVQDAKVLKENILDLVIDFLAIGFDPKQSVIFKQSDVSEHTELAWIFDTITPMAYLERSHAYKDAEANKKEITVGVFNYPMLMAADILLYDTEVVPVGQDQKQHVEYARDAAQKFNHIFKTEIFKLPESKIMSEVAVVPGTDGRKMSKSYGNTIPLFASLEEITKAVMSIQTDSKGIEESRNPDEDNVFKLHKLFASNDELLTLRERYEKGGLSHKESKEMLIKNVDAFIAPLREKRTKLADDTEYVLDVLKEGGKRAKQKAEKKMEVVREAIGVKLY